MSSIIIAIVIMMAVGGGIAYLADWLGFTMGKKRLTLFGLRPRTTARLLTVVGGAIIALLTFLLLLGVNRGFAIAIQRGAEILHTNHVLTRQNRALQAQEETAVQLSTQAKQQAAIADQKRIDAESQLRLAATKLAQAQNSIIKTQADLNARQTQLQAVSENLAQAAIELTDARQESRKLQQQNRLAEDQLQDFSSRIIARRQHALIYRNGAEIGRTVINSGQSIESIRSDLRDFIDQLSADSIARGAYRGANGHAVQVATVAILSSDKWKPGSSLNQTPQFADENANIGALAEQIHGYDNGHGSVVVIAKAFGNAFAGEQAIVTLTPYRNHLVIKDGTILGTITINSTGADTATILALLQRFLVKTVRPAAIHFGVIPVVDPQVHDIQVGNVTLSDLYKIVDQLHKISGAATVTASTDVDTYSADQVRLAFSVTPANQADH